jgi:predicted metal-dependent hydrolase
LKYRATIQSNGVELPVDVIVEHRSNVRYSLTQRRVTLRVPRGFPYADLQHHLEQLSIWVDNMLAQKPELQAQFVPKTFQTGNTITVGKRQYVLQISEGKQNTSTALLKNGVIALLINNTLIADQRSKTIKTLLSRVVARDFKREISERVMAWNERTVRKPIKSINLKYNHSNWGSCSTQGNINLSTRLLFAPDDVQDYVIVHELAHLVEANHSDRFWALVEKFMPNYVEKEEWLRKNRHLCDF